MDSKDTRRAARFSKGDRVAIKRVPAYLRDRVQVGNVGTVTGVTFGYGNRWNLNVDFDGIGEHMMLAEGTFRKA